MADDVDLIDVDERRFKQVLLNLLSNAVKFTPDGGSVCVDARREGTDLVVTVTDTGPGVAAGGPGADLRLVPAGQLGSPEGGGHGSRSDAVADGWSNCSAAGCGSRAPRASGARSASRSPVCGTADARTPRRSAAVFPSSSCSTRIRASQDLVEAYLDGLPAEVMRAWDGEKALDLVQTVAPAAVVLEVGLPGLDGWQVIARLKADPATAAIPVIVASTVDDRPRGLALGAAAYLLKPIRRDELVDALRRVGCAAECRRRRDGRRRVTVLAVDDQPINLRLLDAVLAPRGHRVLTATSGADALALLETEDVDLVLLDILMPGMDGHEVCRRIRSTPATEFLPVVMITASGDEQRLVALQSGADDFITKPFDQAELLARVASLARIKRYHDTIRRQADELARWNAELETRVAEQVAELERTNRLRHFLSPQLADLVVGDENLLQSHRREIVVVFCRSAELHPLRREPASPRR